MDCNRTARKKWFVFKELFVDGRFAVEQEDPDICPTKGDAAAAFRDAFGRLLGRKAGEGQCRRFSSGQCVHARSGRHVEYRFTLIRN